MSPSALILGRYQLQDLIAAGGMGEVWRAVDIVLERPVAIKRLRADSARQAEAVARFRREARQAGSVCHPAVASVYDFADAGPSHPPYLVMELVDGPSLAAVLSAGPLDPARAMDVIAQAAAGLHAAHLAGVVHRDVKPANLLFDRHGRVKVTDFGIAHTVGSALVPGTDMIVGTPAYLAPERAAGTPAAPACDVYSLGIVAYECLTGRPPFTGIPLAVLRAHRDLPLPPLPGTVPAEVAALVAELHGQGPGQPPGHRGRGRRPGGPASRRHSPAWCRRRAAAAGRRGRPDADPDSGAGCTCWRSGQAARTWPMARPAASTRRRRGRAGRPAGHARRRNTDHGHRAPASGAGSGQVGRDPPRLVHRRTGHRGAPPAAPARPGRAGALAADQPATRRDRGVRMAGRARAGGERGHRDRSAPATPARR